MNAFGGNGEHYQEGSSTGARSESKVQGQVVGRGDTGVCISSLLITSVSSRNIKQDARRLSSENEVGDERIGLRIEARL